MPEREQHKPNVPAAPYEWETMCERLPLPGLGPDAYAVLKRHNNDLDYWTLDCTVLDIRGVLIREAPHTSEGERLSMSEVRQRAADILKNATRTQLHGVAESHKALLKLSRPNLDEKESSNTLEGTKR
jgi:hypothetical protein